MANSPHDAHVLTIKELAAVLRIPYKKALSLVHSGEIHGRQIGNVWRIPEAEVDRYLNADRKVPA